MRKQTKLAVVLSAAALLAMGASMTSFADWAQDNGEWVYLNKNEERTYNEWKKSGKDYYYLNDDGVMATDTVIEYNGKKYYVDATGKKVTNQWVEVDNEDDVLVNNVEVSTIWYYFDDKGQAVNSSTKPKKINGKYYIFDESGYMMSGWATLNEGKDLYYLGDENEGWAYTGWQYLEPDEDESAEAYDDNKWFYFKSNGKAVKGETKYIEGRYYTFKADGTLVDDWYTLTTPPAASGAEAFATENGTSGLGWVYAKGRTDTDKNFWYYLTNIRNDKNEVVARAVPFNYNGEEYAAKSIKSKTYLFNDKGEMKTGLVVLEEATTTANGGKKLEPGTYYFNENDGSVEGQMMTGKVTVEEDGEYFYYCFDKDGRAFSNAVKNSLLYGADGKRIQAEDGNQYTIYTTPVAFTFFDKKKDGAYVTIPQGAQLLVNANGKIRTANGTATIEDVKYNVTFDTTKNLYTVVEKQ